MRRTFIRRQALGVADRRTANSDTIANPSASRVRPESLLCELFDVKATRLPFDGETVFDFAHFQQADLRVGRIKQYGWRHQSLVE